MSGAIGKLIKEPLTYEQNGVNKTYDFVFFSDQRYYEYYQTPAASGEALRLQRKKSAVALNTPIVLYSWDQVTQALMAQGIVSETDGVFYVTDMPRLLAYINEGKKWSEIGVGGLYGSVNIASTDPVPPLGRDVLRPAGCHSWVTVRVSAQKLDYGCCPGFRIFISSLAL